MSDNSFKRKHQLERNVIVNGTHIHVKSVFGNIPLEKVLANIAERKIAILKQNIKS